MKEKFVKYLGKEEEENKIIIIEKNLSEIKEDKIKKKDINFIKENDENDEKIRNKIHKNFEIEKIKKKDYKILIEILINISNACYYSYLSIIINYDNECFLNCSDRVYFDFFNKFLNDIKKNCVKKKTDENIKSIDLEKIDDFNESEFIEDTKKRKIYCSKGLKILENILNLSNILEHFFIIIITEDNTQIFISKSIENFYISNKKNIFEYLKYILNKK